MIIQLNDKGKRLTWVIKQMRSKNEPVLIVDKNKKPLAKMWPAPKATGRRHGRFRIYPIEYLAFIDDK
jgi:hypothetical protein